MLGYSTDTPPPHLEWGKYETESSILFLGTNEWPRIGFFSLCLEVRVMTML